jgi:hypothetical protein|tara:strand:+ start:410 stop:892 length:483 start_codon:yes stop_codon:yes gene_type:complete
MIRLNYSSSGVETNALWVNRIVSASEVLYALTSSYDQSTWEVSGSIISNKTQNGDGWLLVETSKNLVPTASGQWFADISPYIGQYVPAIWNETGLIWANNNANPISRIDYIWNIFQDYLSGKADGGFIDTERVWVSGSNDPIINDYVSPNENGTFNTYQY